MALLCNVCFDKLGVGIIYRTACRHFLCPECAKSAFTENYVCPVCQCELQRNGVSELVLGCAPSPPLDTALQIALQEPIWSTTLRRAAEIHAVAAEASTILLTQALLHSGKAEKHVIELQMQLQDRDQTWAAHAQQLKAQVEEAESFRRRAETLAAEREVQLQELEQLLQEQLRRCQAWERAYTALRGQLKGRESSQLPPARPRGSFVVSGDDPTLETTYEHNLPKQGSSLVVSRKMITRTSEPPRRSTSELLDHWGDASYDSPPTATGQSRYSEADRIGGCARGQGHEQQRKVTASAFFEY